MDKKIVISKSFNPAYNLGLEEYLIEKGEDVLYLWQNDKTIVIGRSQNPYRECNIKKINEDKINLVRRRSGGGAVYHDLGNLNFTIISKKKNDNIEKNFNMVNKVLHNEGIESIFNGRNDLNVNGKKISGNAFFEENNIFCHHGTLLVDVNINKLSSYLVASKLKLQSKGIKSIKSRVVNLKEIKDDIKIEDIKESFIKAYGNKSDVQISYYDIERMEENKDLMKKVKKYKSWEWTYGESPKSNVSYEKKFSWGIINGEFFVKSGIIESAKIYTDSIIIDEFEELANRLKGKKFEKNIIIKEVKLSLKNKQIIKDLEKEIDEIS